MKFAKNLNTIGYKVYLISIDLIRYPINELKQNKKQTKYVFPLSEWNYKAEKHLYTTVTDLSTLKFENEIFPVPKNYDLFLTEQYGNYMELPKDIESCYNRHRCISLDFGGY